MFEQNSICPYTGLRSFNEEESLYFEGRELQITDITRLLEKNHFLMVTGASGDGKSSVVYAGIIPNARAGFFKSRFPNWVVADFRPEKSPLRNFSKSLTQALDLPNVTTVETELKRGFSSLIDLYKNSPHFVDDKSQEWLQSDDSQRREKIKKGANLMILVDQFEEFFTTQENFMNGVPSQESQITLNVILETAKIALRDNIPIYIICTMRSDYIGQCAAFRGLPEYIGFSQFFVPRLKRNQLQQVIEEPAKLSGNSISRRLVERLIYDLSEGIDQLPILQHALNQIWRIANQENEEMDLVHYAMVGGMPVNELPEKDKERFLTWYKDLPEYQRKSYKTPSLENVLDIHANRLYESAAAEYNKNYPDSPIAIGEAKRAIGLTFACLSRMDEGRGVRNRMTLQEITDIINNPQLDARKVGRLLDIFRLEGNTFIRPFIFSENDNSELAPESVLDITHESLIRNWKRLQNWAWKESDYLETFLDFKKQLDRWIQNKQSRNYLLPVGPLGYFENWYRECQPNAFWINRYQDAIENRTERLSYSENILQQSKKYLKKSAQKHLLAKAFMKYGARNIAIAVAILSTIILSSFYYTDAVKKQNDQVINHIYSTGEKHINNEERLGGFLFNKAEWLTAGLINDPDRTIGIIENIASAKLKVEVPLEAYVNLLYYEPDFSGFEKDTLIAIIRRNIDNVYVENSLKPGEKLGYINKFIAALAHDEIFNPSEELHPAIKEQTERSYNLLIDILSESTSDEVEMSNEIYLGIQYINNFSSRPNEMLGNILPLLSPFEDTGKENFDFYFPKSSIKQNGADPLSHNGGYQMMAEVYATLGQEEEMYNALNNILQSNNLLKYASVETLNNYYHVFGYLLINEHTALMENFIQYAEETFSVDNIKFCRDFIDRSGYYKNFNLTNLEWEYENHPGVMNPFLSHLSPEVMSSFFDFATTITAKAGHLDEQHYFNALFLKDKALITNKYLSDKRKTVPVEEIDSLLIKSFEEFEQVGSSFLEGDIDLVHRYFTDGIRKTTANRKQHFLYPDIHTGGYIGNRYLNGYYIDFLKRNPSFQSYYTTKENFDLFVDWIYNGHEYYLDEEDVIRVAEKMSLDQLTFTHGFLSNSDHGSSLDMNLLNLLICNRYFTLEDTVSALNYYDNLDLNTFKTSSVRSEYLNQTFFFNQVVELAGHFAKIGDKEKTHNIINTITEVHFRMKAYFIIAREVHNGFYPEDTYHYIESGYKALDQFDPGPLNGTATYTFTIIETLSGLGSRELDLLVNKELSKFYPGGSDDKNVGLIRRGKYYQALEGIPESNTIPNDLSDYRLFLILDSDNLDSPRWSRFKELMDRYGIEENNYIPFATN